jgi:SAM-dependent methyltransferase
MITNFDELVTWDTKINGHWQNRNKIFGIEAELRRIGTLNHTNKDKVYLHLGCGRSVLQGYTNIDKYSICEGVTNEEIYTLPNYADNSVDMIYTNHVLEHLPLRQGHLALAEWHRVLKPNGELVLALPDAGICADMLRRTDLHPEFRRWFKHTLYGYQADMTGKPYDIHEEYSPGQVHLSGWAMWELIAHLQNLGFFPMEWFHYEGMSTPSMFIRSTK